MINSQVFRRCRYAMLLLVMILARPAFAGHLSMIELLGLNPIGTEWEVEMRLSVGAGMTGITAGADGNTRTMAIVAFGSNNISITDFSPAQIMGEVTDGTYTGLNLGSQNSALFMSNPGQFGSLSQSTATLAFADQLQNQEALACIDTTALCGDVHIEVFDFSILYSEIPIGIRVYGVEGNGNLFAGVYPNDDMSIDFSNLSAVPIPGAAWLLGTALIGLVGLSGRRSVA